MKYLSRVLSCAAAAVMYCTCAVAFAASSPTPAQSSAYSLGAGVAETLKRMAVGATPGQSPTVTSSSQSSVEQSLNYFQKMTGTTGVTVQNSVGSGDGQGGLAQIGTNQYFDVNCSQLSSPVVRAAANAEFKILRCEMSSANQVSAVDLQVCTASTQGGTCEANNFSSPLSLATGKYFSVSGMQVGTACNTALDCRITVQATNQEGGNQTALQQASDSSSVLTNPNSWASKLLNATQQGNYNQQLKTEGASLANCASQNAQSMQTSGTVSNCSQSAPQTVSVASDSTTPTSQQPQTCLKWNTLAQPFTQSCAEDFALTQLQSESHYSKTLTCQVTQQTGSAPVSSCASTTGYTQVGKTAPTCLSKDASGNCAQQSWTEYWVDFSSATSVGTTTYPYPSSGTCDTNPLSETRTTTCPNGDWFGRTLATSACEQPVTDTATGASTGRTLDLDFHSKPGCGVCLTPQVNEMCYANTAPSSNCSAATLQGCSLQSVAPDETAGSLVLSQTAEYSCQSQTKYCAQWSGSNSATVSSSDLGLSQTVTNSGQATGNSTQALVQLEIADATAQGVEGSQSNQALPLIFGGQSYFCSLPTGGFLGSIFSKNCCDINLKRPSEGGVIQNGCSMEEAELAAARRSQLTTYIGSWCSSSTSFPHHCLQITQGYCGFKGLLARLVQEQGRQQLAQIVGSSASLNEQQQATTFPYYSSTESGQWSPQIVVNGVDIQAWEWPSYCADPQTAANMYLTNPNAQLCSSTMDTWFATCGIPGGCGALPSQPSDGSGTWQLQDVDPLKNVTTAVSPFATVTGQCSAQTGQCAYTDAAWPAGQGGKVVVTKELSWPLYSNAAPASAASGASAQQYYQMNNMADFVFKGYSVTGAPGTALPSSVRLDYSSDGGQTWQTTTLPTTTLLSSSETLPGDISVTGGCDTTTNLCDYHFTGTFTVSAKPWGPPQAPDCSGFTAGQLSVMNFGKMNLSEWLSQVQSRIQTNVTGNVLQQGSDQASSILQAVNSGGQLTQTEVAAQGANFARIVPAQGFGPFQARLAVSGYWPQTTGNPALDTDKVIGVTVDWDDCSLPDEMTPITPYELQQEQNGSLSLDYTYYSAGTGTPNEWGYSIDHTFPSPDSMSCKGNPQSNFEHHVTLTVQTLHSGTHVVTLNVMNAWAAFPGEHQNNVIVPNSATATVSNPAGQTVVPAGQ